MRDRGDTREVILTLAMVGFTLIPAPSNAQVDTLWTRRLFLFTAGFEVTELAFGPGGDIYAAGGVYASDGYEWRALRYTVEGVQLWPSFGFYGSTCCAPVALAVDQVGDFYTIGQYFWVAKCSALGIAQWANEYGNEPLTARAPNTTWEDGQGDLAVDDSGYVTALSHDFTTTRIAPTGEVIWARNFHGAAGTTIGYFISVSGGGDVWSSGPKPGAGSQSDIAVIHYSRDGDSLWTFVFDGPAGYSDLPREQVLDEAGNLHVTGYSGQPDSSYALCTFKLTPDGDLAWTRLYNDFSSGHERPEDIALDPWGNVIVTGRVFHDTEPDLYVTLKYSAAGDLLWARTLPNATSWPARRALATDTFGSIYVTGIQYDSLHPATVKYSADGQFVWGHQLEGTDILVDDSGYVYLGGISWQSEGFNVAKLSQIDTDSDLVIDVFDNCPSAPNTSQANGDSDSLGDACDNCPQVTNPNQALTVGLTGDLDQSNALTSADIILLVNFVFKSGAPPAPCLAVADANCSQLITSADIVVLVNYVFKGGQAPCDVCLTDGLTWSCP